MRRQALVRLIGFFLLAGLAFAATGPLIGLASGLLGWVPRTIYGITLSLLLFVVTWLALRLGGESFAAVGLILKFQRVAEFAVGFLATATLFAAGGLVRATAVGASWQFWGANGFRAAVIGLPVALILASGEELVFRGYGLRQLIVACGTRSAVLLSALAFGLYHLAMAGFRPWGMGAVFVFALSALGGLLFGSAMIRTRGLALPLGLHVGGNWVQANVLVLGIGGGAQPTALFTATLTEPQMRALAAPDILPHVPYLLAIATAGLLVGQWPQLGGAGRPTLR